MPLPCSNSPMPAKVPVRLKSYRKESRVGDDQRKAKRSRGNHNLRRPAIRQARCPRIPNSIPIERHRLWIGDQTIRASASRVDLKEIAGAMISVSIEDDADRVIGF